MTAMVRNACLGHGWRFNYGVAKNVTLVAVRVLDVMAQAQTQESSLVVDFVTQTTLPEFRP